MKKISSFSELPAIPAVYALYGGQERGLHVAYIGMAGSLKSRIKQHLVSRDSSVTTGVNAVNLDPNHVTKVAWWEHFEFSDRVKLTAAELVAFDVLKPILRSRGNIEKQPEQLYQNKDFYFQMRSLFENDPTGYLKVPTLQDAFEKILEIEKSITDIQKRLEQIEQKF